MAKLKNGADVLSAQKNQYKTLMELSIAQKEKDANELKTIDAKLNELEEGILEALGNGNEVEFERLNGSKKYFEERRKYLTKPHDFVELTDIAESSAFYKSIKDDANAYENELSKEIRNLATSLYLACKEMETVQMDANNLMNSWNGNIQRYYDKFGAQSYHSKIVALLRELERCPSFRENVEGGVRTKEEIARGL